MNAQPWKTLAFLVVLAAPALSVPPPDMVILPEPELTVCFPREFPMTPYITEMSVTSNIKNRFAVTTLRSTVSNPSRGSQQTTFFVVLPDDAFVSRFTMQIGGVTHEARVQEKEQAQKEYNTAVEHGAGAAHVAVSSRNANKFEIAVNLEASSSAVFTLVYEELLQRKNQHYQQVINVYPRQYVPAMSFSVSVDESVPLKYVRVLPVRSSTQLDKVFPLSEAEKLVSKTTSTSAVVHFAPPCELQKEIATALGTPTAEGMAAQFVVEYEVERDPNGGEVLVQDEYFAHFFAPSDLTPLNMHVIFVMDTSGSMFGTRIRQLKESMTSILKSLKPGKDLFSLVEFNTGVKVWNLDANEQSVELRNGLQFGTVGESYLENIGFPPAYPTNADTVAKATRAVDQLQATGSTNTYDALVVALYLIKLRYARTMMEENMQPLIFFLTDGEPTVGITQTERIIAGISELNMYRVPITSLSFGNGADRDFLERLSLANNGFARHVYEAADATLQLENFYSEVSSPLLRNVIFKYAKDVTSLTISEFPVYYFGSEIVVMGRVPRGTPVEVPEVRCIGPVGPIIYRPVVRRAVAQMERLWVYKTIKMYLEKAKVARTMEYHNKALQLALKYQLVTPLTSMVVTNLWKMPIRLLPLEPHIPGRPGPFLPNNPPRLSLAGGPIVHKQILPAVIPTTPRLSLTGGHIVNKQIFDDVHDYETAIDPQLQPVQPKPVTVKLPASIQQALPWLSTSFRTDGSLSFLKGNYQLGLGQASPANQACTTPESRSGSCKLLEGCPKIYPKLTGSKQFIENFCPISGNFAGVCCPA